MSASLPGTEQLPPTPRPERAQWWEAPTEPGADARDLFSALDSDQQQTNKDHGINSLRKIQQ